MLIAVHQPNYLPWPGYFHKIARADVFVFLEGAQFSKGSYTNRVRILRGDEPRWLTQPVRQRLGQAIGEVAFADDAWVHRHLDILNETYRGASAFAETWPAVEEILLAAAGGLAEANRRIVAAIAGRLGLPARFVTDTDLGIGDCGGDDRLIALVKAIDAGGSYLSGAGGRKYQDKEKFAEAGVPLVYVDYDQPAYDQGCETFVPASASSMRCSASGGTRRGGWSPPTDAAVTLRVLCLDIEGGYGGSSRSLFETLRHLDRDAAEVEVWCGRAGPVAERYAALGIPCRVVGPMPRFSALPRASRNVPALARAALALPRWRFLEELAGAAARRDVVHLNHESLFLLARWLRPRTRARLVMHLRTNLVPGPFARWQARTIAGAVDAVVFITENEQASWRRLGLAPRAESVIYNIAAPPAGVRQHPAVPRDGRFRVACISNYAWVRGVDRLVEVAEVLAARGRSDFVFVLAGDARLRGSLPGELGRIARKGGTLADFAAVRGVADMFVFLGHVAEPESVLIACDATARPSREDNPWGRETLESLAAAKPVVATGTYARFVEDGVTGLLLRRYDAEAFADALVRLADDRALAARLGEAGRERVARLCDGRARARDLLATWTGER